MVDVLSYAIARFRPLPETGEFANIGIVAAAGPRNFAYKMVPKRYRRVSQFFNTVSAGLFANSIDFVTRDLEHVSASVARGDADAGKSLTRLTSQNEEAVVVFSDIRVSTLTGSIDDAVDDLYGRYIGRNFVSPEYSEQVMAREIRSVFRRRNIIGFREDVIDDGVLQVKFPFVSRVNGTRVIKPISLTQKSALGIIDHAAMWHDRLAFLFRRSMLDADKVLLPLATPNNGFDPGLIEALASATEKLASLDVAVIDSWDESRLIDFAKLGATPAQRWLYG